MKRVLGGKRRVLVCRDETCPALCNPDVLTRENLLDFRDVDVPGGDVVLDGNGGGHACALTGDCATHHLADGGVGRLVSGDTAAGDEEVVDFLRINNK